MPLYQRDLVAWTGQLAGGDNLGFNPVASTTYYIGTLFGVDPGVNDNPPGYFMPRDGRLVGAFGRFAVVGTVASTHTATITIRKNATTDLATISTGVVFTAAVNDYSNSTFTPVSVSRGDSIYARLNTPAWSTSPTLVFAGLVLSFEAP